MNLAWQNFWKHPKSTISGFFSFVIGLGAAVSLEPSLAAMIPPKVLGWIVSGSALAKLILLVMSRDAGTAEAKVPGTGQPIMVPSHEVPDNPSAKAITPQE